MSPSRLVVSSMAVAALMLAACPGPSPDFIQCRDDMSCYEGGRCLVNPATGHKFCAYPDPDCPSGMRWSDLDVEQSISGQCVLPPDAGMVDAMEPDAMIDAMPPPDAGPDGGGTTGWAVAFGGSGVDEFRSLAIAPDGGIVAAGVFEGTVAFGGSALTSAGGRDAVVVKLDASGGHVWSRSFGGTGTDTARAVIVDAAGDVYVAGTFVGTATFDGMQLTSAGERDGFLMKLNGQTGARVWVFRFGGTTSEDPNGLAISADGTRIAMTGQFAGTASFGGSNIASAGVFDVFLAVYATSNGSHVWSKGIGGTSTDEGTGVAFDGDAGVIVVGVFRGSVAFGGAQPLASAGGTADAFVARYAASNGAHVWSFGYGTSTAGIEDKATGVRVVGGAAYVVGQYGGTVSLGGGNLTSAGGLDGFIAKYDAATGSHTWSASWGGTSEDGALSVAVADRAWFSGKFSGTTRVGNATYTSAGISDAVFASYSLTTGSLQGSGAYGSPGLELAHGIAATAELVCVAGAFAGPMTLQGEALSSAGMSDAFVGCGTP